jgi:hypothetical protein
MATFSPNSSEHTLSPSIAHAGVDQEKGVGGDIGVKVKEGILAVDWNGPDDPSNPLK